MKNQSGPYRIWLRFIVFVLENVCVKWNRFIMWCKILIHLNHEGCLLFGQLFYFRQVFSSKALCFDIPSVEAASWVGSTKAVSWIYSYCDCKQNSIEIHKRDIQPRRKVLANLSERCNLIFMMWFASIKMIQHVKTIKIYSNVSFLVIFTQTVNFYCKNCERRK